MVDLIDKATTEIILEQSARISGLRRKVSKITATSSQFCIECSEPIPSERQQAIPGCRLCIDCQQEKEKRQNEF